MDCDYDLTHDADVEIVLNEGQIFYACADHIADVIKDNASTENPVHSVAGLED